MCFVRFPVEFTSSHKCGISFASEYKLFLHFNVCYCSTIGWLISMSFDATSNSHAEKKMQNIGKKKLDAANLGKSLEENLSKTLYLRSSSKFIVFFYLQSDSFESVIIRAIVNSYLELVKCMWLTSINKYKHCWLYSQFN